MKISQLQDLGSHETPGTWTHSRVRFIAIAESVGVLKDVRTSYKNQPKANVFSWSILVLVGRFRQLGVDVQHKEAKGLSSFACRGYVR